MATTVGTTFPIAPVSRKGMLGSDLCVEALDANETITAGDVLIVNGTTRDLEDNNSAASGIFGVAMLSPSKDAVSTTVDRTKSTNPIADEDGLYHGINVALAMPGQAFAGNLIGGATADATGVYASDLKQQLDLAPSTDGYACVERTSSDDTVFTLRYVTPQLNVSTGAFAYGLEAGVGITNPRVEFVFEVSKTVFG